MTQIILFICPAHMGSMSILSVPGLRKQATVKDHRNNPGSISDINNFI